MSGRVVGVLLNRLGYVGHVRRVICSCCRGFSGGQRGAGVGAVFFLVEFSIDSSWWRLRLRCAVAVERRKCQGWRRQHGGRPLCAGLAAGCGAICAPARLPGIACALCLVHALLVAVAWVRSCLG